MNHMQPSKPYVSQIAPPGSLQEWMLRALAVRSVQEDSAEPVTASIPVSIPAQTESPEASETEVPLPVPADEPADEPTEEPEPAAAAIWRARLAPQLAKARLRATGMPMTWAVGLVAVVAALAVWAIGVGSWQSSVAAKDGAAAPVASPAAASELTAPAVSRPVKPAAFGEVVKLDGWQVKIAGMKNSPELKAVPGLTTAAYPRALRMSVTLVNTADHALAADSWVLSATVNGKPVQMIGHPSAGYVGVPHQTIRPGDSIVFPVAVALPTSWADLAIEAVNADASQTMSFAGKG